ncbi:hypothetical protein HNO88_004487 [Novosphingobium chloroacetimidivorans]|uniref:Uncharacterized protein n=1 Tax=Novosphingobium chloroacetimidivorans TaxID=1428314 RepID=A0A7W7KF89_9SPHN|nr:hypothetical protein [Novosphingobium chloroacetimidivorans]MBB4861133.1 hypothetical protein [Novosphingobium chloroacetimidivorans]
MTPLERAARRLCELDGHRDGATINGITLWQDYLPKARAVLLSLREPSDAMLLAADSLPCSIGTAGHWKAMVEAALNETDRTA